MPPEAAAAYYLDEFGRVIVLIHGTLDTKAPFWCFVSVKPSQYQNFLHTQHAGRLNLYDFTQFGEVIASGEGKNPPELVMLRLAEVYQTDASNFFEPLTTPSDVMAQVHALRERAISGLVPPENSGEDHLPLPGSRQ